MLRNLNHFQGILMVERLLQKRLLQSWKCVGCLYLYANMLWMLDHLEEILSKFLVFSPLGKKLGRIEVWKPSCLLPQGPWIHLEIKNETENLTIYSSFILRWILFFSPTERFVMFPQSWYFFVLKKTFLGVYNVLCSNR